MRKLAAARQQPGWSFSTLFLVKDSLAVMLESAGLLEDALREYAELEALYLTTLQPADSPNAPPFGAKPSHRRTSCPPHRHCYAMQSLYQ